VALAAASNHPGPSDWGKSNRKGRKPPKLLEKGNADQSKPAGGEKSKQRVCWHCGGTGHCCDQCPSLSTKEEAKKLSGGYKGTLKPLDSANTIAEGDNGFDAFRAMETLSDLEEEANEAGNIDNEGWFSDGDNNTPVSCEGFAAAAADSPTPTPLVKVYDSGVTCHLSLYHDHFKSMRNIAPCPFNVVNGSSLATGIGNMTVTVSNGNSESELLLKGILFVPNLVYTLVLIGQPDTAGFTIKFGDGLCIIYDADGRTIGQVPHKHGLYCIVHGTENVDVAVDTVSLETLHRCLSHIAHNATQKMVERGLITGIKLSDDTAIVFCQSCMYSKAVYKAIP
jgi:hypothetical protein